MTLRNTANDAYETGRRVSISNIPTQGEIAKAETSMLLQMALDKNEKSLYSAFVMKCPRTDSISRSSIFTRTEWQARLNALMGDDYTKATNFV